MSILSPNSDEIQRIAQQLDGLPDIQLAYVFGSLASGTANAESDLDIAVQHVNPMSSTAIIALTEQLAVISGRPVDLIDLRTIGEPLLGQILRHGIRIKGDDALHASLMTRHVFAMEDFYPYVKRMLRERREQWIK